MNLWLKLKTHPPTPENWIGKGQSIFKEAIRREAMASPETSPETTKTLSSPSLSAMSAAFLYDTDIDLLTNLEKLIFMLAFFVVNNISRISANHQCKCSN